MEKTHRTPHAVQRLRWMIAALLSCLGSLLLARAVEARLVRHVDTHALSLGRAAFELTQGLDKTAQPSAHQPSEAAHAFLLNGIRLLAQTSHLNGTSNDLKTVLHRLATRCQTPLLAYPLSSTAQGSPAVGTTSGGPMPADLGPQLDAPLLQNFGSTESYLYCLRPKYSLTAQGIEAALREFSLNGDLTAFGQIQGLYVRSSGSYHQLLWMQTEGAVRFDRAFDLTVDAPGRDVPTLPRPPGRRTLSVALDEAPVLNSYAVAGDHEGALTAYREQLLAQGISVLSPPTPGGTKSRSLVARTERETFLILLHVHESQSAADPTRASTPTRRKAELSITRLLP